MSRKSYKANTKEFRAWLKEQRESRGISMRDLAAKLGVPHSYIGKIEQGQRRLDIAEYHEYCYALSVDFEEGMLYFKPPAFARISRSYGEGYRKQHVSHWKPRSEPGYPVMNAYGAQIWPPDSKQSRVFPKREPPMSGD